jgi:predicted acylesterase/phospholipase RssA
VEAPPQASALEKLGLALSGGGFRAAFFHIGVLAWMAENRMLRHVQVVSTVSGGSIVGALYYLHVRDLLNTKTHELVADEDYLCIVRRIEQTFLEGVEKNLRGRGFSNLLRNFQMAAPNYSRTNRIGQLYDATFYRPAWNAPLFGERPDLSRRSMIRMRELRVQPPEGPENFNPVEHNRDRKHAPVPILVLNATSINTGHNWRFEAVGMGEPDLAPEEASDEIAEGKLREDARREIDRNDRLRWTRYDVLPAKHANFELGYAVAASSCVPTLFHPLPISDLFEHPSGESFTVQLVDGGVHDNQGIEALIEYDCNPIIVSDASGYLPDERKPSTRIPAVAGRALGIYGDRVREEQLIAARMVEARRPLGLMHLRKGITGYALSPNGPNASPLAPPRPEPPDDYRGERFPVNTTVQDYLSRVRTDLDAFSQVEAYSLMFDGYAMAEPNLSDLKTESSSLLTPQPDWAFKSVEGAAAGAGDRRYCRHLKHAKSRFGKPIRLSLAAQLEAVVLLAAFGFGIYRLILIDAFRDFFSASVPRWSLPMLVAVVAALAFLYMNAKLPKPFRILADVLYTQLVPFVLAPLLWVGAGIVLLFSRAFVSSGRIQRVLRARGPGARP